MSDLLERLAEQSLMKLTESWQRQDGGQDLCIGAQLAEEAADEIQRPRSTLERIARGPAMPLPDPLAHSWMAFGRQAHSAMRDLMRTASDALATSECKNAKS